MSWRGSRSNPIIRRQCLLCTKAKNKAKRKIDRKPQRQNSGRKSLANQNKSGDEPKPSKTVCRNFLSGSCRFSPCKFKHMKRQIAILAISTNGTAMVKNSSVKSADFWYGLLYLDDQQLTLPKVLTMHSLSSLRCLHRSRQPTLPRTSISKQQRR